MSNGVLSAFCGTRSVEIPFKNGLDTYTPCAIDGFLFGLCYLLGVFFLLRRWMQLLSRGSAVYRLEGAARRYQCFAIGASTVCFAAVVCEFGGRQMGNQSLISPIGSPAAYEYLSFILAALFWSMASAMLCMELQCFVWKGLWTVRFSLCLVVAGQLAKFSFVIQPDLTDVDAIYIVYMVSIPCHLFLALFAVRQVPDREQLSRVVGAYEELAEEPDQPLVNDKDRVPERSVSFMSWLTFSWMSQLLAHGYAQPLQSSNIWQLDWPDHAATLQASFRNHWNIERSRRTPSLARALWKTIGHLYLKSIPCEIVADLAMFSLPIMLDRILQNVEDEAPDWKSHVLGIAICVALIVMSLAEARFYYLGQRVGFQLRSIVTAEVYRKILFLNPTDRAKFTTGRIVNFVSADAETLQIASEMGLCIFTCPIRILLSTALLYDQLGVASLVTLAVLLLTVPCQISLMTWSTTFVRRSLHETDRRAKFEEELIAGIETVKFNAWEKPIWNRIMSARSEEQRQRWKSFILVTVNYALVNGLIAMVSAATFGVYVLMGNELNAAKAFVSLTLMSMLRLPALQLPLVSGQLLKSFVSIKRVEPFLIAEEQDERISTPPTSKGSHSVECAHETRGCGVGEVAVRVNGDFSWSLESEPLLQGLDLELPAGSLTAVVGRTGSGKTSVLSSIIGLMHHVGGAPTVVRGRLSFVPQSPFIINATVRENILFGHDFREERYHAAVHATNLGPDIASFPNGDATELGERGINISGGQKQRVALARAIYSDADVCLLDDPLSALDARVGQRVFRECIVEALRDKTVILVTNQLQYVDKADQILFVRDGKIVERGTYRELMQIPRGGFAQMMTEALSEQGTSAKKTRKTKPASPRAAVSDRAESVTGVQGGSKEARLIREEHRVVGWVSKETLMRYIDAIGGRGIAAFILSLFVIAEAISVGSTVWLSYWKLQTDEDDDHGDGFYVGVYALIALALTVATLFRQLCTMGASIVASRALHQTLLTKLFRLPMQFFHTTPIGRILNRLTKDLSAIDNMLAGYVSYFLGLLLELISNFLFVAVVTPVSLPFLVPIVMGLYFLYLYFQSSSRELKRMDSIARSQIYSSLHDAVNGLATIRAFNSERRMLEAHMEATDRSVVLNVVYHSVDHWFNIRAGVLGAICALAATVSAVEQRYDAALVGLAICHALTVPNKTGYVVRCASRAEVHFNSVERVTEYSELEEEAPEEIPGSVPDRWPDAGAISFRDVEMRYRSGLPLVLKGLSAVIEPKQRVGVVGRTGAGKSSLMNVLLRMVEVTAGHISIDGIDTSRIGLRQLRSSIAVIPQVPFLFTGSIRTNLDPFQEHSDDVLWRALSRAHLRELVREHDGGLDMELREGGAPLSFGQIQLLSLARAIVRDTKASLYRPLTVAERCGVQILVLDEATANVDMDTDTFIQKTIKTQFHDRTVLIIAHRLHTIIDADKVMVLSDGVLVEYARPAELLRTRDGVFSKMVRDTGDACERFLRAVAFGEMDMEEARSKGIPASLRSDIG